MTHTQYCNGVSPLHHRTFIVAVNSPPGTEKSTGSIAQRRTCAAREMARSFALATPRSMAARMKGHLYSINILIVKSHAQPNVHTSRSARHSHR